MKKLGCSINEKWYKSENEMTRVCWLPWKKYSGSNFSDEKEFIMKFVLFCV